MWRVATFAFWVVVSGAFSSTAMAEPVVLVSKDGHTRIRGDLLKYDKTSYVVQTSVGKVTIPMADVNCEGAGCPDLSPEPAAQAQAPDSTELSQDQQLELFRAFLEWRKNSEDFNAFLEWRRNNAN